MLLYLGLIVILWSGCIINIASGLCPKGESCGECVRNEGCGFCDSTQQCVEGGILGPFGGDCSRGWSFQSCSCSIPQTCEDCFKYDACLWCQALDQDGMCLPNTYVPNATCPLVWQPNEICPDDLGKVLGIGLGITVGSAVLIVGIAMLVAFTKRRRAQRLAFVNLS